VANLAQEMVDRARADLSGRLGLPESEIAEASIEPADFPDAALGAPLAGEMSAQVITSGWRIRLKAGGQTHEYRANDRHLRLVNFQGANHRVAK
jgi:hypothetical protein